MPAIRGSGLPLTLGKTFTNLETLAAGATRLLPAGPQIVHLGQYSFIQYFDPVLNVAATGSNAATTGVWKTCPRPWNGYAFVECDGANQRIANLSGCQVGAIVTTAGSGYTSPPTVTAGSTGAAYTAIIGGLINTSQTVPSNAGSGYTIPPRLVIQAPPSGGVQATAHTTLSSGVVNSIVIDNQGAGYVQAPVAAFVTDPNDLGSAIVPAGSTQNTGTGPVANAMTLAVTGAGTIAAIVMTNPGTPQTSVPSLTISGGGGSSGAATALMNFAVTGYTVSGTNTGFGAGTFIVSSGGVDDIVNGAVPAHTNPAIEQNILFPRQAKIVPALSAGAIVASGTTAPLKVEDWGIGFTVVPQLVPVPGTGLATGACTVTATVGGQTDFIYVQSLTG